MAPVMPSRTGSTWSPADLVSAHPGHPERVVASFVVVNLIFALLGTKDPGWRLGAPYGSHTEADVELHNIAARACS